MADEELKMRSRMIVIGFLLLVCPSAVFCADFLISHSPDYLRFHEKGGKITTSDIPAVMTAAFGFTPKHDISWTGLEHGSLFHRPKANVLISLHGIETIQLPGAKRFPADVDAPEINTEGLASQLKEGPQGKRSLIVDFTPHTNMFDIRAQHPTLFGHLPATLEEVKSRLAGEKSAFHGMTLGSLDFNQMEHAAFLGEIQIIQEMLEALKANTKLVEDGAPDLFHFRLMGVGLIAGRDGTSSKSVREATDLLNIFLHKLTEDIKKLYKNNVLVEVVTLPVADSAHVRKSRSLKEAAPTQGPEPLSKQLGVSQYFGPETAAIFNIILWTLVVLALSVVAVSVSMWTMDPGRDSIIYRMTSQRIKKD